MEPVSCIAWLGRWCLLRASSEMLRCVGNHLPKSGMCLLIHVEVGRTTKLLRAELVDDRGEIGEVGTTAVNHALDELVKRIGCEKMLGRRQAEARPDIRESGIIPESDVDADKLATQRLL